MSTALAVQWIDEHRQRLIEPANEIWNYAEVGLRELRSAEALIAVLRKLRLPA